MAFLKIAYKILYTFYRIGILFALCIFKVYGKKTEIIKGLSGVGLIIRNSGYISIGDNTILSSNNPIGNCHPYLYLCCLHGATLTIGSNTGISNSTIFASKKVAIGNHVMIGADCKIYDTDFHSIEYAQRIETPDTHVMSRSVIINDGAFIGAHTIILKGSVIGKRAVIGAGSVIAGKTIGDDELWAGNPVRFIRKINQEG